MSNALYRQEMHLSAKESKQQHDKQQHHHHHQQQPQQRQQVGQSRCQQLQQHRLTHEHISYHPAPIYRAVIAYTARCDGEITLRVGDVIDTVKSLGNGWTVGRNCSGSAHVDLSTSDSGRSDVGEAGGGVGIFPSSCVRRVSYTSLVSGDNISDVTGSTCRCCDDVTSVRSTRDDERTGPPGLLSQAPSRCCCKDYGRQTYGSTAVRSATNSTIIPTTRGSGEIIPASGTCENKPRMIVKPNCDKAIPSNRNSAEPTPAAATLTASHKNFGVNNGQLLSQSFGIHNQGQNHNDSGLRRCQNENKINAHTALLPKTEPNQSAQNKVLLSIDPSGKNLNHKSAIASILHPSDAGLLDCTCASAALEFHDERRIPTVSANSVGRLGTPEMFTAGGELRRVHDPGPIGPPPRRSSTVVADRLRGGDSEGEGAELDPWRTEFNPSGLICEGWYDEQDGGGVVDMESYAEEELYQNMMTIDVGGKESGLKVFNSVGGPPTGIALSTASAASAGSAASAAQGDQAIRTKSSAKIYPRRRRDSENHLSLQGGPVPIGNSPNQGSTPLESKEGGCGVCFRLLGSVAVSLFIGVVIFQLSYYPGKLGLLLSSVLGGTVAVVLAILLTVSRVCRCVLALLVPSVCTGRGRGAFTVVMMGMVFGGPLKNVYFNMQQVARSLSCSAERSYNQTLLLLEPFDAMMHRINETISGLQEAAQNVWEGLSPLNGELGDIESELYNGQLQLHGTGKTCRYLVERAHTACTTGILGARDQCLGVIGALGSVYNHAREILDTLNPDRWAPVRQGGGGGQQLSKRQVFDSDERLMLDSLILPADDADICEPLSSLTVCQTLNDSASLCLPSTWAGDAIYEAINSTRVAMLDLRTTLQFHVTATPYSDARLNASAEVYGIRRRVFDEFVRQTFYVPLVLDVVTIILLLLGVLLLVHASLRHVRRHTCIDAYDNIYVTRRFRDLNEKRRSLASCPDPDGVLPLRSYELKYLADTAQWRLSDGERHLFPAYSGLSVFFLQLVATGCCFAFDALLYSMLSLILRHGGDTVELSRSLGDAVSLSYNDPGIVVTGDGMIAELVGVFIKAFRPRWFGRSEGLAVGEDDCLPDPLAPSLLTIAFTLLLNVILFFLILSKARVFRLRNAITAYFNPERETLRTLQLYGVVLAHRRGLRTRLRRSARSNHVARRLRWEHSLTYAVASKLLPVSFRIWLAGHRRCLVCGVRAGGAAYGCECPTAGCAEIYCAECIKELEGVCPVCCAGADELTSRDCLDWVGCCDVDDCLMMHCLESRRYYDT